MRYGVDFKVNVRFPLIQGMGKAFNSMMRHCVSALCASSDDKRWNVLTELLPVFTAC